VVLSLGIEGLRHYVTVALCLLLLGVDGLLSQDEFDVKAIVDLVLLCVFNGN